MTAFEPIPSSDAAPARVTPMMAQYFEIKSANPDCLLFYRMGDFYELFFEDAEIASRTLGIVLTKRGKHQGADIPMCGVPVERSEDYLHRLISAGHRVAVCEQTEDPAAAISNVQTPATDPVRDEATQADLARSPDVARRVLRRAGLRNRTAASFLGASSVTSAPTEPVHGRNTAKMPDSQSMSVP